MFEHLSRFSQDTHDTESIKYVEAVQSIRRGLAFRLGTCCMLSSISVFSITLFITSPFCWVYIVVTCAAWGLIAYMIIMLRIEAITRNYYSKK
jgi:hypothetical protein